VHHIFDEIGGSRGSVRLPFSLLLNSPQLAGRTAHLGTYLRFESALPNEYREIAMILAAREADGAFQWGSHTRLAREAGVREEVIDVIGHRKPVDGLTDDEALIITYGREILRGHKISQATFDKARARFGDQGLVDLTGIMGYYTMLAVHLNAYAVEAREGTDRLP
jgi:4-carboxymuconolactone decarboxylase